MNKQMERRHESRAVLKLIDTKSCMKLHVHQEIQTVAPDAIGDQFRTATNDRNRLLTENQLTLPNLSNKNSSARRL